MASMVGLRVACFALGVFCLLSLPVQSQGPILNAGTPAGWDVGAHVGFTRTCAQTDYEDGHRVLQAGISVVSSASVTFDWGQVTPPPPGVPRGMVRDVNLDATAGGEGTGTPTTTLQAYSVPVVTDSMDFQTAPASNSLRKTYDPQDRTTTESFVFYGDGIARIDAVAAVATDGVPEKTAADDGWDSLQCTSMPWVEWWQNGEGDCGDNNSCSTCVKNVDPNPWPPVPDLCVPRNCDGSQNQPFECCDDWEDHSKPECSNTPWGLCGKALGLSNALLDRGCADDGSDPPEGSGGSGKFDGYTGGDDRSNVVGYKRTFVE